MAIMAVTKHRPMEIQNMIQMQNVARTAVCFLCMTLIAGERVTRAETTLEINEREGKVTVKIDGELFTEYVYKGHTKPILYPIIGPYGVAMSRHYPMQKGIDNEANDHPHHESLWFTHDEVSGINFWSSHTSKTQANRGQAVQTSLHVESNAIHTTNQWRAADGKVVCSDNRSIRFGGTAKTRHIDYQIAIHASNGDVTFADTKEGTMAIRMHPMLRLAPDARRGNHTVVGHAINSEGDKDRDLWGKRAKWVDYWGAVKGKTLGIAIFDHPANPRHPTWWHARHYGLVAANPFGIHDFERKPKGVGDMVIKDGSAVTFRYRFVFHQGDAKSANIEALYAGFAAAQ